MEMETEIETQNRHCSSYARFCGKHPTQLLTGICSSCLMERLSNVSKSSDPRSANCEIVEVSTSADPNAQARAPADDGKFRTTLLLLFQLDDNVTSSNCCQRNSGSTSQKDKDDTQFKGNGNDHCKKKNGRSSWLSSILPKKGMKWGRKSTCEKKVPGSPVIQRRGSVDGNGGQELEKKPSFRYSYEWIVCKEPSKSASELPRHSWDGSMVGKAFACSFACLDERQDGIRRTRRSTAEENVMAYHENGDGKANSESLADKKAAMTERSSIVGHFRSRSCKESGPEMALPGIDRRKSQSWSKVWDRSITSPLKEFVKKGDLVLERSLSESRKDTRKENIIERMQANGKKPVCGNGSSSHKANAPPCGIKNIGNGDVRNFQTDWLKNRDCKIVRSRSVHYSSPANLDNGLLRFYLTPMRSSRNANRGRRGNSHLFRRGTFGFI